MENQIKLFCDRVEEGIAVLLWEQTEETVIYETPVQTLPCGDHAEGKFFLCTVEDGKILSAEKIVTESTGKNKKRLSSLFKKSRKNK